MKCFSLTSIVAAFILAACAATSSVPVGMKSGQFVPFTCDGGKSFQARASVDGSSVRIRYEGGYELDNTGSGIYESDSYKLVTVGPGAVELFHNGKTTLKNCKPA